MREGCEPVTGWAGAAGTGVAVQRRRSRQNLETGPKSAAAAGWVGSCDAGMADGSGCVSGSVGGGVAVVVAAAGAGASVGAAAGAGAGSSGMR